MNKLVAVFYFRIFYHKEDKGHEREVDENAFWRVIHQKLMSARDSQLSTSLLHGLQ